MNSNVSAVENSVNKFLVCSLFIIVVLRKTTQQFIVLSMKHVWKKHFFFENLNEQNPKKILAKVCIVET